MDVNSQYRNQLNTPNLGISFKLPWSVTIFILFNMFAANIVCELLLATFLLKLAVAVFSLIYGYYLLRRYVLFKSISAVTGLNLGAENFLYQGSPLPISALTVHRQTPYFLILSWECVWRGFFKYHKYLLITRDMLSERQYHQLVYILTVRNVRD